MTKIIVHDGKAHQDDFLAACVCAYKLDAEIYRRKPDESELLDSDCWILDQGLDYNCSLHNFDHHHIEEKICSFTMILDYFYNSNYREYMPNLKYLEIFDSYGPLAAAEFAGVNPDSLENIVSPIHLSIVRIFSKIEGLVSDPVYSVMKMIGEEICSQIESIENLLEVLKEDAVFIDYNNIRILDTTSCKTPENFRHDQLPTKIFCRIQKDHAHVILTKDSRSEGYFRMISTNLNNVKFVKNDISEFTHNSGFLTSFNKYDKFYKILDNYVIMNI